MNVRQFMESDFSAIKNIYKRSKLDELRFESQVFQLLPLESDAGRLAELKESDIYVYVVDSRVVAYGAHFKSEVRALFVHPDSRGLGIGRSLLEFLLSKIAGAASLYVAKTNVPAKRLYRAYGFFDVDEFETSYNGVSVYANKMSQAESVD